LNKDSWLKLVKLSKEAHHLREIFNGTYALLVKKDVQDLFLNRINYLLDNTRDAHTKKALEDLKEDIELEIEHGTMRKQARPFIKTAGRPSASKANPLRDINDFIDEIQEQLDQLRGMVQGLIKQENEGL
jgi:uncharacterized membrane protein YheB (UPF0754 family)